MYSQRIHIAADMFPVDLIDFPVVINENMVPELTATNWLLDSGGVASADLSDLRIFLDSDFIVEVWPDVRHFVKHETRENREIELEIVLHFANSIAGNDIWLVVDSSLPDMLPPGGPPTPGPQEGTYEWDQAIENNLFFGDVYMIGYIFTPELGTRLQYEGNEAAFDAFRSVPGGYFHGDYNARFVMNNPLTIYDASAPDTVIKIYIKLALNQINVYQYFIGHGGIETNKFRLEVREFGYMYLYDDANNINSFDVRPYKDDQWHWLELAIDETQFALGKIDGNILNKGTSYPFTSDMNMQVICDTRLILPAAPLMKNTMAVLQIWKSGSLIARYSFEHANAAGNGGPGFLFDMVGANHAIGRGVTAANWKRGVPNTIGEFNLYSNASEYPIMSAVDDTGREINRDSLGNVTLFGLFRFALFSFKGFSLRGFSYLGFLFDRLTYGLIMRHVKRGRWRSRIQREIGNSSHAYKYKD